MSTIEEERSPYSLEQERFEQETQREGLKLGRLNERSSHVTKHLIYQTGAERRHIYNVDDPYRLRIVTT